jgi:hypothetical protein
MDSRGEDRVRRGSRWPRIAATAWALVFLASGARATTNLGSATVRLGCSPGCGQQIFIPWGATQFETPAANLSREFAFPNEPPFWRSHARAVAGIDIEAGALYGTVSAFTRESSASGAGNPGTASALVSIEYAETFEIVSDTLADGALVDVTFDLSFLYRGSMGASGIGSQTRAADNYRFAIAGRAPGHEASWIPHFDPASRQGVLAGGIGGDPMRVDLGPFLAEAVVGGDFILELYLEIDSYASAKSQWDGDAQRYAPGQAELAGSAALFVSTTVSQADAGFAAAARAPGAPAYLRSLAGGFVLPGLEVFDSANLDAHLLPLVPVPEPASVLLVGAGMVALSALRQQGARRARRRS